ncbi:MAG: ABC transporter ATP-binding protein/permease [Lachnospiraceae bacterium]|nr:ABC transporter ATP-binding protein/permease [Lachnospiraceae bacterium]
MAENENRNRNQRPMGRGMAMGPRPKLKKGIVKRLLGYIFKYYTPHIIVVAICLLVSSLSSIAMSVIMQRLIDEVINPGLSSGWSSVVGTLTAIITTIICIYGVGILCTFIYPRLMAIVTQGTQKHLRDDMFSKMQSLPIKYFDTHAHGDIMSTYTNDTDATRQLIGQSIPSLITSSVSIVSLTIVMLSYSVWLFLLVIVSILLTVMITGNLGMKAGKFMMGQQKTLAKEEGFVEEMMTGLKVVKVFTHEDEAKNKFEELNNELFRVSSEANKNGNILGPITNNVGNIFYVVVATIGGMLFALNVKNVCLTGVQPLTLGIVVTFLGMFRQMSQMVGQITQQITMVAMGFAGCARVFELIDEEPEKDEGYVELVNVVRNADGSLSETKEHSNLWAWKHPHSDGTTTYTELKGCIELEMVDFGYVPEKLVLEDVSLRAEAGQKFAFVGATGAGKTTITNLINRFYDIPDGKIRFDGINVSKIKKPDLRRSLGLVLQEVNLFTGTVMDNIRYGRLDATDEECIEAAKLANAHDFITRLPEGYATMLTGNGASLSQGQRQLLSIARAAVANTPAMILDEATSSIDTRTEALVQDGMDKLMKGRTVFVIAHRLSTVRNSDSIIVLEKGHIIERGTHDELIAMKKTYYQLYTGAFELD